MRHLLLCIFALLALLYNRCAIAADAKDAPYVVIFLIDGARSDLVHSMIDEGRLPNFKKLFIDNGLDVRHGTTVFPTTSTNAYQSFMTGLFPGHAGIPYLARYSRSENKSIEYLSLRGVKIMNADLLNWYQLNDPNLPFLFTQGSLFNHLHDYGTASVYATFFRDAAIEKPQLPLGAAWATFVLGDHEKLDVMAYNAIHKLFSGDLQEIPHMSLVALLAIDILAHQDGWDAPRLKTHFETIDKMLGDFYALLEKRGIADKTYIVVVGDHGNHNISKRSYLKERLIKEGIAIRSRRMRPPYELAINARGVSAAVIAVAGDNGWPSLPTLDDLHHVPTRKGRDMDLIAYLREQPETDLLLVRNGNHRVRVYSNGSESEVTRVLVGNHYWYSYRIISGGDPLHYTDDPKLKPLIARQVPLTAAQWLPLTAKKEYGDAIVQISQIFTDGRVGDIVIVPKSDWVFRHEKANTHGALMQDDMHIPIMIHGPTIAQQSIEFGRSVDVMPTILSWFGKTTPHRDGQDLLNPDPPPGTDIAALAAAESAMITGKNRGNPPLARRIIDSEFVTRRHRVEKLSALSDTCKNKHRVDNQLLHYDRPKKLRASTCEVIDLALKTAYEDLQRLNQLSGQQHATDATLQN